jgi:toxin ParE1/3/4
MLKRVKFAKEASFEFRESVDWYESMAKGFGLKFTAEIDSTVEKIKLNPDLYRKVVENVRRIQVTKFPYSLFFSIEDDTVVILRVFHNKRKPVQWHGITRH